MKLAVFAYNFPHKKTQDFLFRLFYENQQVEKVLAADPVDLDLPESTVRVKPEHVDLIDPERLSQRLGFSYQVLQHDSEEAVKEIRKSDWDIGIISGARILPASVINAFNMGVINFHPGLLPEARGLDALKWTILADDPPGVTAHFIDERVDAGRIIKRQKVPVYDDDTFVDLSLRLQQTEVDMLGEVLAEVQEVNSMMEFEKIEGAEKNEKMPPDKEEEVVDKFSYWKEKYSVDRD